MTDGRLNETSLEVTVGETNPDARLNETSIEVPVFDTDPAGRLNETSLEVTVFAVPGDVRVYQEGLEVAVYGNGSDPPDLCVGTPSGETHLAGPCAPRPGIDISTTFRGYRPKAGVSHKPVCGTCNNMTAARSPTGRAILGWNTGDTYYCALLDDVDDVFRDNTVGANNRREVNTYPGGLVQGSLWTYNGELYCAVTYNTTASPAGFRTDCLKADDPDDPVVWTLQGVVDNLGGSGGGGVFSIQSMGQVTVSRSGRWLLPCAGSIAYGGSQPSDGSALFSSANLGVTWAMEVEHRQSPLQSGTTGPIGNTIAQDPNTGYLYWSHYWGPLTNQGFIYESQNDGDSWAAVQSSADTAWNFYTDDGRTKMYAALPASGWRAYEVIDPTNDNTFINTGINIIDTRQFPGEQFQFNRIGCVGVIIDRDRTVRVGGPKWWVGMTGRAG